MKHRLRQRYGRALAPSGRNIEASSYERYNGGIRVKRQYGSATVTRFYVFYKEDRHDPSKWEKIEAKGRTPGDRKTDAINQFIRLREPHLAAPESKVWG